MFSKSPCKIKENLIGTNSINYLHNYYLSILNSEKIKNIDTKNREIGNIKIMSFHECIETIRPYHTNKIKIIIKYTFTNKYLSVFII